MEKTTVHNLSGQKTCGYHELFLQQQRNKIRLAQLPVEERLARLKKIEDWILSHRHNIQKALFEDFRKPAPEVELEEIYVTLIELRHTRRRLRKWIRPRRVKRPIQLPLTRGHIRYQPRGVVLIISPWNFPFMLCITPLISAIAAGNCVVLKPSEISASTSHLVKTMISELFPPDEVAVVEGGKEVAGELLKLPFDHIYYTGGSIVGKIVMEAAAKNLTSVTLELGGKSPAIVDETAQLTDAAKKIVWGKFINGGQMCVAPDYLFIQKTIYTPFLEMLKAEIRRIYGDSEEERQNSPDMARIIDQRHYQRLKNLLQEALASGGKIEIGQVPDNGEKYIPPTIVSGVGLKTHLMKEEIFGPILPVLTFDSLDEVFEIVNLIEKPLAVYIFSKNKKNIRKILSETSSGGSCINDVLLQYVHPNLPFGGVRESGFGNSHGFYGFRAFSQERAILKSNRFNPFKLLYPPYTRAKGKLIDLMIRYL